MTTVNAHIINPGVARGVISRTVAIAVRREMNVVGRMMVEDAVMLMRGDFNLDRPYERRRWPGSRRAATALDFTVEGGNELPLKLGWRVVGGDQVFKRILGLNFGTGGGHEIKGGTGTWPLKGKIHVNRMGGMSSKAGSRPDLLAWIDETSDVMVPEVWHPGSAGTHFLEEALELAEFRLATAIAT